MREINICNHVFSDILALTQSSSQNKAHELRIETPGTCVGIYLAKHVRHIQTIYAVLNYTTGLSRIPTDPNWKAAILHLVEWYVNPNSKFGSLIISLISFPLTLQGISSQKV